MGKGQQYGEGNYDATRRYNKATKRFVESGKVDKAAHDAAPASDAEALQLAAAEAEGRSRAKEEDPILTRTPPKRRVRRDQDANEEEKPGIGPEDARAPMPGEDASS
jgi:hypothetical protein